MCVASRAASLLLVWLLVSAALACTGTSTDEHRTSLVVSAAISLSEALTDAVAEFEQQSGVTVTVNAAGSDTLATQIIAGARADLFLSADTRQMDRVQREGLVRGGSRVDLFSNELVAVVRRDAPVALRHVDDLRGRRVRRIAVGDPDAVPAGVYARAYLRSRGMWEPVRDKLVPTRSVRAALVSVQAGHADVGFVYRTDLVATDDLQVAFPVPRLPESPIVYPGAVLTGTSHPDEALRFLTFLREGTGRRIFKDAGFLAARPPEPS